MTSVDRWQLPDGIEEVLPEQAAQVELLRRRLLDQFRAWGYELVIPPLVEFTDSLLIGLGQDLDLRTFKLTDQISGRSMGVRADITPQVARIDAHSLGREGVCRLCYAGSILHTRSNSLMASRSPIQLGAELFGDDSLASDVEVIRLMLATLALAGVENYTLDLGHVGVYRAVLDAAGLDSELEARVFDCLQRKSLPDLHNVLAGVAPEPAELILGLLNLHGDDDVLSRARALFERRAPAALAAVEALQSVAQSLRQLQPELPIYYDLAELRGYHYHTGLVFAAYVSGHGKALANGGRYNGVGEVFGRARPATGFNTDLKALMSLTADPAPRPSAIAVPDSADPALAAAVQQLRAQGEIVIHRLPSGSDPRCSRELVEVDGDWRVQPLA
ncbi:ATP phosphoribosyltransferase regulatory subunit [Haliea sp. E17]|uniref:ATP phosphoribosyltransferase regulatory subunit n=1 Tax=Haliea sp. E17 TaxID=3401576 RepID=UPI003AAA5B41